MRKRMWVPFLLLAVSLPATLEARQLPPTEQPRTLTVNAVGTVEREPEQGVIVLAVESEAANAQAAATANAQRMTQLTAALRRAGVPERSIRTISYELRPEYATDDRGRVAPRIAAYRAINMVQVTVDEVARLGGVIDAGIGAGANRVASIRLQLRDVQSAQNEALAIAMRNARTQADAIAAAAGERLGPPMSIHTGGFAAPPMPPMAYARAEGMDMASTPIEGGTLTVQATVNVVYRLIDQ
jgi:uncharacterized protein